mmetsp:Transcript_4313/g.19458  ORF Transcript_4313/g.19458 Transcript_4313/m.19458 type:complete len:90 (-) Transcript_4313:3246-3515(-)
MEEYSGLLSGFYSKQRYWCVCNFYTQLSKIQRNLTQNFDPRKPSKQKYPATRKKFRMKTYRARGLFIAKLLNFILARALYSHPVSTSQV